VFAFLLTHAAALALIVCAAFGAGSLILPPLRFFSPLEQFVTGITLGLGVMATLIFLLGLVGGLSWWPVFLAFAGMAACGLVCARPLLASALEKSPLPQGLLRTLAITALALFLLAPALFAALFPPTTYDALSYHLPAAKSYLQAHQIRPLPHLRFPVLPALGEMLFAGAMLICDDVTAQLVEFLFLLLVLAAIVSWSQRLEKPLTGLWSVGLLAGTPSFMILGSMAYVDVGLAAFATLGFYALHCYTVTGERGWLTLAGAFGGCAAGTKHSGLAVIAIFAVYALVTARRHRMTVGRLWPFAGAALAFGGPWYLWNAYWTGNPIWPFLGRHLGHGFWIEIDYAWLDWSLRSYGWGRTLPSLLRLPWNLAFGQVVGEFSLQPAPFALLPVTLWWAFRKRKGRLLLAAIAAYVLFWFFTSQQLRFLLPVLPVLVLLDSQAIDELTTPLRRHVPAWAQRAAAASLFIAFSFPLLGIYRAALRNGPLPTTLSDRDAFLEKRLSSYSIYRDLNSRYGHGYTIYAFHDEAMKYYCDGTPVGDVFGAGRYGDVPVDDASKLFQALRKLNADFLLVRSEPSAAAVASAPGSRQLFESIHTDGDIKLFRVLRAAE
jgi:hypothetical protein